MFGYVLPEKPELKVKEFELFKAYYCGVCKSIGKRLGQVPRLTLNYDATFLALILSSIAEENVSVQREKCIAHPIKPRNVIRDNALIDYAADMNILLAYYNLLDNWKDEKSGIAYTGILALKPAFNKIRNRYKEKCGIIEARLNELSGLEKQKCDSSDKAAEPFAKIMEEILTYDGVCNNSKIDKILRWVGYNLGKWIYLLDAYDDLEKDIKKKNYNPFIFQFGYDSSGTGPKEFKLSIKERVEFTLTYTLTQITKAYELLDTKGCSGIVENIVYMGMLRKTEQILGKGSCAESHGKSI